LRENNLKKKKTVTWCIEINTIEMPKRKLTVKGCPKNAAEARPVKIVATVDEYFFKIVSAVLFQSIIQNYEVRGHNGRKDRRTSIIKVRFVGISSVTCILEEERRENALSSIVTNEKHCCPRMPSKDIKTLWTCK